MFENFLCQKQILMRNRKHRPTYKWPQKINKKNHNWLSYLCLDRINNSVKCELIKLIFCMCSFDKIYI